MKIDGQKLEAVSNIPVVDFKPDPQDTTAMSPKISDMVVTSGGAVHSTGPWPKIPDCHSGAVLVMIDPVTGQTYYAGGYSRGFERPDADDCVLIALYNGVLDIPILSNIPIRGHDYPTVMIDWDDWGIPNMKLADWQALLESLRMTNMDVAIACNGGHGRTGTALAILAYLMGIETKTPIAYIRKAYCKKAVESTKQFQYIKALTECDETYLDIPKVTTYTYAGSGVKKQGTCEQCGHSFNDHGHVGCFKWDKETKSSCHCNVKGYVESSSKSGATKSDVCDACGHYKSSHVNDCCRVTFTDGLPCGCDGSGPMDLDSAQVLGAKEGYEPKQSVIDKEIAEIESGEDGPLEEALVEEIFMDEGTDAEEDADVPPDTYLNGYESFANEGGGMGRVIDAREYDSYWDGHCRVYFKEGD